MAGHVEESAAACRVQTMTRLDQQLRSRISLAKAEGKRMVYSRRRLALPPCLLLALNLTAVWHPVTESFEKRFGGGDEDVYLVRADSCATTFQPRDWWAAVRSHPGRVLLNWVIRPNQRVAMLPMDVSRLPPHHSHLTKSP